MAKRVFFSFHYENDVTRANIVRNSDITKEVAGFVDKAEFEKIKQAGDKAVKDWIDKQLQGTSTTVVLIGEETLDRKYVQYEICKSLDKGNRVIAVQIGKLKDLNQKTSISQSIHKTIKCNDNTTIAFNKIIEGSYDYVDDDGYNNLSTWIDEANK